MSVKYGEAPASTQALRDFYDQQFKKDVIKDDDRAYEWMARKLFMPYIAGKTVLDIGCGGGFFLKELNPIAGKAVGMDLSGEALRISSRQTRNPLVQGSAEKLPFFGGVFDAVFCLGSLEHFADIPKALREMGRIVKPQGWIFVMVPNLFWYKDIWSVLKTGDICDRNQKYEFFAPPAQWEAIISEAGLRVRKAWKYNGIAKSSLKQWVKDLAIPFNLSYHIIFAIQP